MLVVLIEKVCSVEFEFCKIILIFIEEFDGVCLDIDFIFVCEVEMLIF